MLNFLGKIWNRFRVWTDFRLKPFHVKYQKEMPDVLEKGLVYIVGEEKHYWCIAMLCPCGCNATIQLNLLPRVRPRWWFTHSKKGAITIMPSIRRNAGCKSHFYIRKARVMWCK